MFLLPVKTQTFFQTSTSNSQLIRFKYLRAIPEKKILGGEDGRQYIFLWVVGAESFQIIWVNGVRPNLITWVVGASLRGRKNIICQKKREVLSNLAKKRLPKKERSFI